MTPGQHHSLAWHQCPWILWALESILLWCPHRHPPWESPLEHYSDDGMDHVLCSFVVCVELFVFQWFFMWFGVSVSLLIHSALFCVQDFEFALPMSDMLCWETPTKTYLSMNQCCALQSTTANLLLYLRLHAFLPRSSPQFHDFSHLPWTNFSLEHTTPACLAKDLANSPG